MAIKNLEYGSPSTPEDSTKILNGNGGGKIAGTAIASAP